MNLSQKEVSVIDLSGDIFYNTGLFVELFEPSRDARDEAIVLSDLQAFEHKGSVFFLFEALDTRILSIMRGEKIVKTITKSAQIDKFETQCAQMTKVNYRLV